MIPKHHVPKCQRQVPTALKEAVAAYAYDLSASTAKSCLFLTDSFVCSSFYLSKPSANDLY